MQPAVYPGWHSSVRSQSRLICVIGYDPGWPEATEAADEARASSRLPRSPQVGRGLAALLEEVHLPKALGRRVTRAHPCLNIGLGRLSVC